MKQVEIFTDGACSGNPGPGGWGAILRYNGREKELSGGERDTTNNRMELTAVIEALGCLKEPCEVTLTTDSKYVADGIGKGWATRRNKSKQSLTSSISRTLCRRQTLNRSRRWLRYITSRKRKISITNHQETTI